MTTTSNETLDPTAVEEFAGRIFGLLTGSMITYMIDLGHRLGLFDAVAEGPGTSDEIADRAGLNERYVREWLGAVVTGGIVEYDPQSAAYRLPAVAAACLAGTGPTNMAPFTQFSTLLGRYIEPVAVAFREGGGVPYAEYRPEFTGVMDALGRGVYDGLLIDAYLPLAPGLADRLRTGARVADVACGTGHVLVLLGRAFPASTFVGYDLDEEAIARARAEAAAEGVTNVIFEVCDVARLRVDEPFDVVLVFDAIHDQADPAGVLDRIYEALVPGGVFVMKEPRVSSNLEENVGNPFAPLLYACSTLHCMTVSLAEGGAGLGTAFGEQLARRMLADAGFGDVAVHEAPGDPPDGVFVTSKPIK